MASQLDQHLPHISNFNAGKNKWDPVHSSIFEVTIHVPQSISSAITGGAEVVTLLGEQVTEVSGLEVLQKTTAAGTQKFHGVDVSFLNPVLDGTTADITVKFNLNLKDTNDNYVLRVFKEWEKLSYDLQSGVRGLKVEYADGSMLIAEGNRNGEIWRAYTFNDIMITNVQGLGSLNYTSNDAQSLDVTFRSDSWQEVLGTGNNAKYGNNNITESDTIENTDVLP